MKDKAIDRKNLNLNENNKRIEINVIKELKEEEYETKSLCSTNTNSIIKEKNKENKGNLTKNAENTENKITPKNNINENIDKRINNFINYSNSNFHNRYYSSKISNHIFRNFIKKANYNKVRDDSNENCIQNYFHFNENRPYSFTSRANNININKGLNYILGNTNPNNMNSKDIIDRKRDGYDYKKYNRGKRNNYINKNIFFKDNINFNLTQNIQNSGNNFNNNYPQNRQLLNNFNNNQNFLYNRNNMTSSKQNLLHMNDFLILDNLDMKIRDIGNSILNFVNKNININNISGQNYNIQNIESNVFTPPLKLINPEYNNIYKNNSNICFDNMDFNLNIFRNPYFGL